MPSIDTLFAGCIRPPKGCVIVEPFVGDGEIMKWCGTENIIIPYDTDPKLPKVIRRNVLNETTKFHGIYVITKPPQLKKSDSEDKTAFEKYGTDNLYKCFIKCLMSEQPAGGILVLPIAFLSGARDSEKKRRQEFFRIFKLLRMNVFDMETVVINFIRRPYTEQYKTEKWDVHFYPEHTQRFIDSGPDQIDLICNLVKPPNDKRIQCRFSSKNSNGWSKSKLVLQWNDTEHIKMGMRMTLEDADVQLQVWGVLSKKLCMRLCDDFNNYVETQKLSKENMIVPFTHISEATAIEIIKCLIWARISKH